MKSEEQEKTIASQVEPSTIPAKDSEDGDKSHPLSDRLVNSDSSALKDPLIGKRIAERYEVLAVLGKGGMSSVYLARHLLMNKVVAIKVLHPHLMTDSVNLQRFRQEAMAASSLSHQNVITVHDFGVMTDGARPFLVMDYVSGRPLSEVIAAQGRIEVRRALRILVQACDALARAHEKGVIHRDLKPSNIMLVDNEQQADFVKIVDFGIAKLLPQEGQEYKQLTQTGETFGSPLYMSPEQCQAAKLDARSDIYSMGCVMYEMLTGRPPLSGGNIYETIYKQINEMPEALGDLGCDRKIREPLEAIVFKALAKDPEKRYQSMLKLKEDLELAAAGQEKGWLERAYALWQLSRLKRTPGRRVVPFKTAAAIASTLLALIGVVCWWLFSTYETLLVHAKENTETIWPLYREDQSSITEQEQMDLDEIRAALETTEKQFGHDSPQYFTRLLQLDKFYRNKDSTRQKLSSAEFARAEDKARAALELQQRMYGDDSSQYFSGLIKLGSFYRINERYADATIYYLRALTLFDKNNKGLWEMEPLIASYFLADCYYHQGQFALAESSYERALQHAEHLLTSRSEKFALIYAKIADCCFYQNKLAQAQERYKEALDQWGQGKKQMTDRQNAAEAYALTQAKLGDVYRLLAAEDARLRRSDSRAQNLQLSEDKYEEARQRFDMLFGPGNRNSDMCLNYLGLIHFYQGKHDQAERDFVTAEKDLVRILGKDDLDVARVLENYSVALWDEGRIFDAAARCSEAMKIRAAQRKHRAEI